MENHTESFIKVTLWFGHGRSAVNTKPMAVAVFQLKESSNHLLFFRGQSVAGAQRGASTLIQHCRLSAGSHASSCFNCLDPVGTSHWQLPKCSWVGGKADSSLLLPLTALSFWLATPHTAFCFLSAFCSLCEPGMPTLILPSAAGSSLGSGSLDQALQRL